MTTNSVPQQWADITRDTITAENAGEVLDILDHECQRLGNELNTAADPTDRARIYRQTAALEILRVVALGYEAGQSHANQQAMLECDNEARLCGTAAELELCRAASPRQLPDPRPILAHLRSPDEEVLLAVVDLYAAAAGNEATR